jgi:hypothetical protein
VDGCQDKVGLAGSCVPMEEMRGFFAQARYPCSPDSQRWFLINGRLISNLSGFS